MKTIKLSDAQAENTRALADCWPECVEESYERLVAAVTGIVRGPQPALQCIEPEPTSTCIYFPL